MQNYNECLHCPIIHPLLNRMHHYLGADNVPTTDSYCGGAMGFKDGVETLSADGKRRRGVAARAGGRERDAGQLLRDLSELPADAPSRLHDDDDDLAAGSPDRTRLVCEWHFHPDEIARPGFVYEDAVEFWDVTNREDWAISERS